MGQPVVLPKFELPGDKPHWAVRLAWVTGTALLVSVLVLGGVILHHRSLEAKVELARQEVIAKAKAEAQAKLDAIAAAVAAARAAKEAELAAAKQKQAERAVPANTVASVAESDMGGTARSGGHVRHGHAGHGAKGLHVAAADKAAPVKSEDPTGKKAARANSAKNDVIDDLLAKMK
jgi:multidrug efflux pump subunit AcrA (membrane-fusion protein)